MVVELILGIMLVTGVETPDPAAPVVTAAAVAADASEAEADAAPEADADPVICRSRMVPSERVGARFRRVEDCRTRSEWNGPRSPRRRR